MWAKSKGIPLLASISELSYLLCIVWKQWLVIEKAKRQWEKYKSMLDDAKAMKEKIDEELSSGTQENAAVSVLVRENASIVKFAETIQMVLLH
ncbi:putative threonine aspartase isoform X3 [Camellia sinensis]|uniref:putative threonine aspartase isoform X3 n=1 Tax=Camellia sinensis TaxID=4442 RepID=UPI0010356F78|nr:putative threonine aspartase isoform X3 [Camellia sinensis]